MARRRRPGPKPAAERELFPPGVAARVPPISRVPRIGTVREHIAALEMAAVAYAAEYASTHGTRPAYVARVTLDVFAADAGYVPGPVEGGRWTTRPPHPLVLAARERLDPAPPRVAARSLLVVPSIAAPEPAPF